NRAVAPVALGGILGIGELPVVYQQVSASQPLDVAAIARMEQPLSGGCLRSFPPERLVVSGIDDADAPRFQAIAQAGGGMIEILRVDRDPTNPEYAFAHFVHGHPGPELA